MIQIVETGQSRIKELIRLVQTTDRRLRNTQVFKNDALGLYFSSSGYPLGMVLQIVGPYDVSRGGACLSFDQGWTDISIATFHDEYRELAKRVAAKYADLTGKNVTIILE